MPAAPMRTPLALVPYAFAAAVVAAGALWHAGDRLAGGEISVEGRTATVGGPFALVDQNGHARTQRDFRGRFMLVYFGYSFCPDVCPTMLAEIASALDRLTPLQRRRIVPVFITVDPARDTPQTLKSYLAEFGPEFVGLTGSVAAIAAAARAYHVYVRRHALPGGGYALDHSSVIYLMGPDGRFLAYYQAEQGPDGIAADLRRRL